MTKPAQSKNQGRITPTQLDAPNALKPDSSLREDTRRSLSAHGLTNEQRAEFFRSHVGPEPLTSAKWRTSAGTTVEVQQPLNLATGPYYSFEYYDKQRVRYEYNYTKDGRFTSLTVDVPIHPYGRGDYNRVEKYDSSNKWAEKRGDSFIRDIQRMNKPHKK
jgi:hypothetical protein